MKHKEIIINELESISELLKSYRKDKKITQEELASYAGLSRTGVIKMESGNSDIKLSTLIKVTNLLGLDLTLKKRGNK